MSSHDLISIAPWCGQVVKTKRRVLYDETQFEPGMLGVIVGVEYHDENVIAFHIDVRPFDDHNTPLLDSNYYDSDGKPCLTAKEANQWSDVEVYYLDPKAIDTRLIALGSVTSLSIYQISLRRHQAVCIAPSEEAFHLWGQDPVAEAFTQEARAIAGL